MLETKKKKKRMSCQIMGLVKHKCKDYTLIITMDPNNNAPYAFYKSLQMTKPCSYIAFIASTPIASNHG